MSNKLTTAVVDPPHANRGVEFTNQDGLSSCIDWVAVTFLDEQDESVICDVIGIDFYNFVEKGRGKYGYKKCLFYNNINIYSDGREDMGIYLEMTGQGCRIFEAESSISWNEFFVRLTTDYYRSTNIKRIDLAIDDKVGYFRITQAIGNVKRGNCVSIFRKGKRISNLDIANGGEFGHTLYMGSPTSQIMFRFYDKLAEMKNHKKVYDQSLEVWNRVEVELHDERAEAVVSVLASESMTAGNIVKGLLLRYIKFKQRKTNDSNKTRWPLISWYQKFLDDIEPLQIASMPPEKSIERTYGWINKSVVKGLAMLSIAFKDNVNDMLSDFLADGQDKMSALDWQLIDDFKSKNMNYYEFMQYLKEMNSGDFEKIKENIKKSAINE